MRSTRHEARGAIDAVSLKCGAHHRLYDKGFISFVMWTTDDLPVFRVNETGELLLPKPRPEERERAKGERPDWLLRAIGKKVRKRKKAGDGGGLVRDRALPRRGMRPLGRPHEPPLISYEQRMRAPP